MSLLIDALRKAEREREQAGAERDDLEGLVLEPMAPATPPSQESERLTRADQQAAANLFDVKSAPGGPGRLVWLAVGGVVIGLALAAYVWWQMQPAPSMLRPPAATTPAPLGGPGSVPRAPITSEPAPSPIVTRPPLPAPMAEAPPAPAPPTPIRDTERGRLGAETPPTTQPPAEPPVRLQRTRPAQLQVPDPLTTAYAAYQRGDLEAAEHHYRDFLEQAPHNVDALNGLGAIALQRNDPAQAIDWFRRALAARPDDPVASAGLASLLPADSPVDDETNLRQLFDTAPDSPAASFALGNALARQQRWAEAQAAYFQAHTRDPDNPDILFNLAVSLDQLGQARLALDYYQRALAAARSRPAAFDTDAAQARLGALGEVLQ